MNWVRSILVLLATATIAAAQPTIIAVQDAAGYDPVLTRGAMVLVTGSGLGPAYIAQANSFPMQTTLSGASIQIQINNTFTTGIPFYVYKNQTAFILPSATPAGNGMLNYTYNGESTSFPIKVVNRNPQIYTTNSAGYGQAVLTFGPNNFIGNGFVSPTNAIQPNDIVILYMQGLGPVTFDETQGALQVSLAAGVQVMVGGVPVNPFYLGRQPVTSSSVDVAIFRWPSGIAQTCDVPITIQIGDEISNAVTAPSTADGSTCSPSSAIIPSSSSGETPGTSGKTSSTSTSTSSNGKAPATSGGKGTSSGKDFSKSSEMAPNNAIREDAGTFESLFSENDFNNWLSRGSVRGGVVTFHSTQSTQLIIPGQAPKEISSSSQSASGDFYQVQATGQADIVNGVRSLVGGQAGQCSTLTYQGSNVPSSLDPTQYEIRFLDAGGLIANGSFGQRTFEKSTTDGNIEYSMEFQNGDFSLGEPITVGNTGSPDVNAFSGSIQSPGIFQVTNLEALRTLDRSNITVNWTPVEGGVVIIHGSSTIGGVLTGTTKEFTCATLASAGTFTVPAYIGNHLDATDGFTGGALSVTHSFLSRGPSNLDFILLSLENSVEQSADYN